MATETITQTQEPWEVIQPYLEQIFRGTQGVYQNQGAPNYFPGQTVAPYNQNTTDAMSMINQMARQGSGVPQAATSQLQATLNNQYLPGGGMPDTGVPAGLSAPGGSMTFNEQTGQQQPMTQGGGSGNPYLDSMYDYAAQGVTRNYQEAVAPGIQAQFANSGRTGSGLYANALDSSRDTLAKNLGGMASSLYGGAYENERGRQMQALGMSPSIAPLSYYDASQVMNVGNMWDAKAQERLNADFERYMYNQNKPWDALNRYMSLISGNYGGQSTQTSPLYGNDWAQNIGLGLSVLDGLASLS